MAPSLKVPLSFLLILVIIFSSSPRIQARESKFFSKVTHYNSPTEAAAKEPSSEYPEAPVYAPTPAPESAAGPASELFQPDTQDGYGLYGRESNKYSSPTTTTTSAVGENEVVPEEELTNESYERLAETSYSNINNNENNNNNNNGYSKYYTNNNNGYTTEKQGMSDTRFLDNGRYHYDVNGEPTNSNNNGYYYSTSSNNNNNGYYYSSNSNNNNNNDEYSGEKQGMSDTRFLDGGKYHYDVNNENNNYYPAGGYSTTEKGYSTSNEVNYYSNTQNSNEFNSMEEFQGQQQEYQEEGQEEYVP